MLPAIVALVDARSIALFQPGGTVRKRRAGARGGPQGRSMLPGGWTGEHEDVVYRPPGTVRLWPRGAAWTVHRHWHGDRYEGWYVNPERPWRETPLGFDSADLTLDVTVAGDLSSWAWKDTDELAWGLEHGTITAADAALARRAGEEAIALLADRAWPFDADDDVWRAAAPEVSWPVPVVPERALRP